MVTRKEEFEAITKELAELFNNKNQIYGDDFFTGSYSELERWLSIRRKVARLSAFYEKGNKDNLVPSETIIDTWEDLAIYAVMTLMVLRQKK